MNEKFLKAYDAGAVEQDIYKRWEESGLFNPDVCIEKGVTNADAEPFCIVLPPPNVTGTLHLGHAFEDTVQDILVRFARLQGKRTLWVPGTDHAAIATQSRVEKNLEKEGVRKNDLGREEFLKRVSDFAQESHDTIVGQVRRLGASLDWSREAYTLDDARNFAVRTVFKSMYDLGLIYRGSRMVNWDPKGQTVISDDEIVYVEETTKFYYFKYGPFTIGTSRPETKFGDKYVVMHPNDARYAQYVHGQQMDVEWINGSITATVIKDESINPEFGTGVMTITPWHSAVDFEIAQRHNLSFEQVIDQYGKLLPMTGEFAGMKIKEAREKIVEKLQSKGLVEKIDEKYVHNVATAERSGGVIEPQIMKQWFIAVEKPFVIPHSDIPGIASGSETTLKNIMRTAVESGAITIAPDRFEKVYFNWIGNLHDWCISRQIWFGHRIPVWYRNLSGQDEEVYCGIDAPEGEGWEQDPDTLDTWFSSGLWPFSTLGWPHKTDDLKTYFPNAVMAPGYEILFFWVARMILMTGFNLGTVPFKRVLLHGIVRDKQGRKFSKSLGNGIDPVEMINKYGADALRMGLLAGAAPGNDVKFDEDRVKGYKNFANKLWNISRFIFENAEGTNLRAKCTPEDEILLAEVETLKQEVTKHIDDFRLDLAADALYHYIWHRLADEILEDSKTIFRGEDVGRIESRKAALLAMLKACLKLLHSFMPFVTEEIWTEVKGDAPFLMVERL